MLTKKEFTLEEIYHEFSISETFSYLDLLYNVQMSILDMLEQLENREYDAFAFELEKDLDLVEKNIKTFEVAVMIHETKIFDKFNIKGVPVMIGNN